MCKPIKSGGLGVRSRITVHFSGSGFGGGRVRYISMKGAVYFLI